MTTLYQTTIALLASYDLHPKKKMGQNFLIDQQALDRIVGAAELSSDDSVLEIGTGLGVLTEALAKIAKSVISLDPDKDMIQISKQVLKGYGNVDLVPADFLKWNGEAAFNKVVANVPYYITSPIIEKLLELKAKPERIVLTVQKEVAERLAASPGDRAFGSFTVFVQNRSEASIDSLISRRSFFPPPDVDSAILVLKPYPGPKYNIDEKLVRAAFSQRRKMIRSSLSKFNIDLDSLGIDSKRRPETLTLEEFEKLSRVPT